MERLHTPEYGLISGNLRRKLSSAAFQALRSCGVFSLAARSERRKNSLVILCYHGLSLHDEHKWLPQLYITAEQFRQRLQALREADASVLPLDEALERLKDGSLPSRSVTITFDDGFYDFMEVGLPILRDYNFPCTVYLTTHYCHHRLPIIGLVLDYMMWKSGQFTVRLPRFGIDAPLPIRTYSQRQEVVGQILKWAEHSGIDTIGKDQVAQSIARSLGVQYDEIRNRRMLQILSPSDVQTIARAGVDVQLHTHRHRVPNNFQLFTKEIEDNRRNIVDLTGITPTHFCYPSGEYTPEFFGWLQDCGVKSATTCEVGLALRNSNSMRLPRVLDHGGLSALRFESFVSGVMV